MESVEPARHRERASVVPPRTPPKLSGRSVPDDDVPWRRRWNQAFNSSRFLNQPRREEALPDKSDLVLDLALFPARGGRAGDRGDEVMAAHLHEAAIVETTLTDEDGLYGSLHIVVDAAPAGALEQSERPVVGVEHHLLRLARIAPHKQHAAVAEPNMGGLLQSHAIEQHDLMASIELI